MDICTNLGCKLRYTKVIILPQTLTYFIQVLTNLPEWLMHPPQALTMFTSGVGTLSSSMNLPQAMAHLNVHYYYLMH